MHLSLIHILQTAPHEFSYDVCETDEKHRSCTITALSPQVDPVLLLEHTGGAGQDQLGYVVLIEAFNQVALGRSQCCLRGH